MTSGLPQRTVNRTAYENRIKNYMPSGRQIRIGEEMTGKEKDDAAGRRSMVAIRPDLYRLALERGIDIGDACNRALASLTGSAYPGVQQEKSPALPPVIIAKDGATPQPAGREKKAVARKTNPVINADDPAAPATVAGAKIPVKKVPPPEDLLPRGPEPGPEEQAAKIPVAGDAGASRGRAAPKKKPSKTEALKTFFARKIARTGDAGDHVGKDEFYELFVRFCRENRITPVPERKAVTIALKTRFALSEAGAAGTQVWTGIRVK